MHSNVDKNVGFPIHSAALFPSRFGCSFGERGSRWRAVVPFSSFVWPLLFVSLLVAVLFMFHISWRLRFFFLSLSRYCSLWSVVAVDATTIAAFSVCNCVRFARMLVMLGQTGIFTVTELQLNRKPYCNGPSKSFRLPSHHMQFGNFKMKLQSNGLLMIGFGQWNTRRMSHGTQEQTNNALWRKSTNNTHTYTHRETHP